MFEVLEASGAKRVIFFLEPSLGLRAILVIDDLSLGPGVGGIRTKRYRSVEEAALDAARLARAMTIKTSLAGLDAGGAKMVVMEHDGLVRAEAFRWLGARIQELGGIFRTAGDFGTTDEDLAQVEAETEYVHREDGSLAAAVAEGLSQCLDAVVQHLSANGAGWSVSVQGAGSIGAAVARHLAARGLAVTIADIDRGRAERVALEIGARVVEAPALLAEPMDVFAPCAIGGVIDAEVARRLSARAIVGAANNILTSAEAGHILHQRGICFVPDPVASAGAVIAGISRTVMNLGDPGPLLRALRETTLGILSESRAHDQPPTQVAEARAWRRIEAAREAGKARRG